MIAALFLVLAAALNISLPNYTPREYQKRFAYNLQNANASGAKRRFMWVVHRRGGKDLVALHETSALMHERRGAYWHVFPTAEQGRKAIWEGFTKDGLRLMEQVFPRALRKSPREFLPKAEMVVEMQNGSIWRLLGSDKIEVVGAGPVGIVFSEFALAKPAAWNMIRPMLRENDGWAAFITTPRGNNHAKKLYDLASHDPAWFTETLTLLDTRAYDPEATIAAERAEGMPESLIQQEYFCDWSAALVGSVWGDLIPDMQTFEHAHDGVHTSWDLGFTDATAVWFWRVNPNGGLDFIDHYESHGKPLSHYFDEVERRGYGVVTHWLPHDARARTLATGTSIEEQFRERYPGKSKVGPGLSLLDGVQAGRWLLQQGSRFHARCADGADALRHYHYEYDEDRKRFGVRPEHDWSSHTADAFRYAAIIAKHVMRISKPAAPVAAPIVPPADRAFHLEQLFAMNQHKGRRRV